MKEDKAYSLLMDSEEVQVYCHMTDIPGCDGGGWTLVMKLNGSKVLCFTMSYCCLLLIIHLVSIQFLFFSNF